MPLSVLLHCNNLNSTRACYQALGFTVTDTPESTLTVALEDCRLVFTEQHLWPTPVSLSGTLYLAISDVDHYFERVKDQADIAWPVQLMPYGSREFAVRDCNGYLLAFTQRSTAQ
ncbi:VOC family protein [Pseudomonas sp. NPDC090755]|uniref:VOC family protein n=1 Tax=Pseudomonas sp. NPDC090755 TaxID=3364481 RepID=UPI00383BC10D